MSVSSVSSNPLISLLSQFYYQNLTSNSNTDNSNSDSAVDSLTGVTSVNSDGDTFQMSGMKPPTMLSADEMYSKMDTDSDGSVSESEFIAARPSDVTEDMAAVLYKSFDTDSSGSLTAAEFTTAMNSVSATSSSSGTAADQSTGGSGTAAASSSCPLGKTSCTGCGQCGKLAASNVTSNLSQSNNSINIQTGMTKDYLADIAEKAYEMNSVYL